MKKINLQFNLKTENVYKYKQNNQFKIFKAIVASQRGLGKQR